MGLTGCEVHNTVRPQATTVGFNLTRQDDNRDVMSINVRRIPSSWPKLARMGLQLPEECRCALEEDLRTEKGRSANRGWKTNHVGR